MAIILHVDMDAFYASVEEARDPSLKGKPLIIGSDPKGGKGRGVVATASYAARKFGVHSAQPISVTWRLCPQGVYKSPDFELYSAVSKRVMALLRTYGALEQVSIDEAYLDATHLKKYELVEAVGKKIKSEVLASERITCSVGIGPNKLIAKIASDHKKPDGLTVVKPEEVLDFISPLPVKSLRGVGPVTREQLEKLGIKTVEDLRNFGRENLVRMLGSFGDYLYEESLGHGSTEIETSWEAKSISRETTFERDTRDRKQLEDALRELIDEVVKDVEKEGVEFKTVTLKFRYEGFDTHTKSKSVLAPTKNRIAIENVCKWALNEFLKDSRRCRLIGVRVGNLSRR